MRLCSISIVAKRAFETEPALTSDITEYDVPVDAEPPPASDVIDVGGG